MAASHAMAWAASPSSHAPPSLPPAEASARYAAHCARTRAVHSRCSAELPSRFSKSAREMCAQTFTGCPARSGSSPLRAGVYARLSETYDAAELVPTQIERGTDHARRRG
jgi:hypothetical protein